MQLLSIWQNIKNPDLHAQNGSAGGGLSEALRQGPTLEQPDGETCRESIACSERIDGFDRKGRLVERWGSPRVGDCAFAAQRHHDQLRALLQQRGSHVIQTLQRSWSSEVGGLGEMGGLDTVEDQNGRALKNAGVDRPIGRRIEHRRGTGCISYGKSFQYRFIPNLELSQHEASLSHRLFH